MDIFFIETKQVYEAFVPEFQLLLDLDVMLEDLAFDVIDQHFDAWLHQALKQIDDQFLWCLNAHELGAFVLVLGWIYHLLEREIVDQSIINGAEHGSSILWWVLYNVFRIHTTQE